MHETLRVNCSMNKRERWQEAGCCTSWVLHLRWQEAGCCTCYASVRSCTWYRSKRLGPVLHLLYQVTATRLVVIVHIAASRYDSAHSRLLVIERGC